MVSIRLHVNSEQGGTSFWVNFETSKIDIYQEFGKLWNFLSKLFETFFHDFSTCVIKIIDYIYPRWNAFIWNGTGEAWPKDLFSFFVGCAFCLGLILLLHFLHSKHKARHKFDKASQKPKITFKIPFLPISSIMTVKKFERRRVHCTDFSGVYDLHNCKSKKNYVGQSQRVMKRVNDHLTGHGCRDVYRDYKNGDKFYIHTIPFKGSGYRSLNALERDNIAKYSGYTRGYNKTKGNIG